MRKRVVVRLNRNPYPYTAFVGQIRKRYRWHNVKSFDTFYAAERWLWRKEKQR